MIDSEQKAYQAAVASVAALEQNQTALLNSRAALAGGAAEAGASNALDAQLSALDSKISVALAERKAREAAWHRAMESTDVPTRPATLPEIIREATIMQEIYSARYTKAGKLTDVSTLPIIAAAAVAAGIAIDNPTNAVPMIGYTGLAATAYAATMAQIFPKDLPALYIGGYAGMSCVVAAAGPFLEPGSEEEFVAAKSAQRKLGTSIATVESLAAAVPAADRPALNTLLLLADVSVKQGRAAAAETQKQLAAWRMKESAFLTVAGAVAETVARKARVRVPVDFETLRNGFLKAGAVEAPDAESVREFVKAAGKASRAQALEDAIRDLLAQSAAMADRMPDYAAVLTKLEKCPDRVVPAA